MLIKAADDRTRDFDALRALASRPDATPEIRRRIDIEIRKIQSGVRGESAAAYQIDFHFKESKKWMIIHDLRLECGDRVAQIDHLLLNRLMQIYVCESKSVAEGVGFNDQGEFVTFYQGRPSGIASPVEQNRRHMAVLEAVFKSGTVQLPRRLGFALTPALLPLVLVTTNARISRPRGELPGHDTIIKSDQIKARVDTDIDADNNPLQMAKLIGADTLQEFAQRLAEEHRPIEFDWAGRFGLPLKPPVNVARPMTSAGSNRPAAAPAMSPHDGARVSAVEVVGEKKSKLVCAGCGSSVAYNVAKFCWFNKPRFGGLVYCIDCQKNVPKPA